MAHMENWNRFIESVLGERKDKPNNEQGEDGKGQPSRIPLTSEKGVKNNGKK